MLGGSTQLNFMMWVRGNKGDYDSWATMTNDPSWNYDNVLPYFKKTENYTGNWPDPYYHGTDGEVTISRFDFAPGQDQFLQAAAERGYTVNQDYNGANQQVFSAIDASIKQGWRADSYTSFYKNANKASMNNLKIVKYAQVTKIIFDSNKKAVGVNYMRQGAMRTAKARNEIILSAGAINSPQILMLSGVGPSQHLQSFNIPVVKDLPVGQNFQDHVVAWAGWFLKGPSMNPNTDVTPQAVDLFLTNGSGILGAPATLAGQGFIRSPYSANAYPDIQIVQLSVNVYKGIENDFNKFFGYNVTKLQNWFDPYYGIDGRFVAVILDRPKSVGQLTLASSDYNDPPILDPQYLSHPDDLEALLYGYKEVIALYENTTALNATLAPFTLPGCENLTFRTDAFYRCVISQMAADLYHHVGSCSIGKVVESSSLKVIGVSGLRVIDASVIPQTPTGNTQAATFMVAERGADMILSDW